MVCYGCGVEDGIGIEQILGIEEVYRTGTSRVMLADEGPIVYVSQGLYKIFRKKI